MHLAGIPGSGGGPANVSGCSSYSYAVVIYCVFAKPRRWDSALVRSVAALSRSAYARKALAPP